MNFDRFFYPKNTFFIYLFVISIPFYFFIRPYSEHIKFIFSATIILFVFSCTPLIIKYIKDTNFTKLKLVEWFIVGYLSLILVIGGFSDLYIVNFLVAYVCARLLFVNGLNDHSEKSADAVVFSSTLAALGVILGALEKMFLDTDYFWSPTVIYPYFSESKTSLGGLFYNHNGAAYCIATGIACVRLTSERLRSFRKIATVVLACALITTLSKIGFLCILLGFIFTIMRKLRSQYLFAVIILITLSYLFFSSVIIAPTGSYVFPNMHYREVLFSIGNVDFILGYYGHHKLVLAKMLTTNLLLPIGSNNVVAIYGSEPHMLFGSLLFSAGLIPWLATLYFITLVVRSFSSSNSISQYNVELYAVLCAFLIESMNWDFGDNFYFWILISAALSLALKHSTKSSRIVSSTFH